VFFCSNSYTQKARLNSPDRSLTGRTLRIYDSADEGQVPVLLSVIHAEPDDEVIPDRKPFVFDIDRSPVTAGFV
jgi:hypothetical protein